VCRGIAIVLSSHVLLMRQIHGKTDGTIEIFSRSLDSQTLKYPDVIATLPKALKETTTSYVIDTEVIAYDANTSRLLPFQV
jgi:DNA ligase 1